jgi:UDP-N-acetylmuramyl pentapeptide phosphotransferase/UDP-N-acetylglucosamine-1-phosphate transferase
MPSPESMRVRLQIEAIFIAVYLGALTVTLLHDPTALIPHPPYGPWIFVRLLVLSSLAVLGILLVLGVVDDRMDIDETDG